MKLKGWALRIRFKFKMARIRHKGRKIFGKDWLEYKKSEPVDPETLFKRQYELNPLVDVDKKIADHIQNFRPPTFRQQLLGKFSEEEKYLGKRQAEDKKKVSACCHAAMKETQLPLSIYGSIEIELTCLECKKECSSEETDDEDEKSYEGGN